MKSSPINNILFFNGRISRMLLLSIVLQWFSIGSVCSQNKYSFEVYPIAAEKIGINAKLSQGRVADITEDDRGLIWIGTLDGLNRYDGYHVKVFRHQFGDSTSIDNNQVLKILNAPNGNLWVLTKTGINNFNPYTEKSKLLLFPNDNHQDFWINDIATDKVNNLWIGRNDGLYVYRMESDEIEKILLDGDNQHVEKIEIDHLNNVWIGGYSNFIIKYNHITQQMKSYTYPEIDGLSDDYFVYDIHEDKEHNIWVAVYNDESINLEVPNVYILEEAQLQLRVFNEYLPILRKHGNSTYLSTVRRFESKKNELYFATMSNGMAKIDHQQKKFVKMPEYSEYLWNTEMDKNAIYFDKNGDTWLGTNGEGVFLLPGTDDIFNIVTQYILPEFKLKSVRSFLEYGDYIFIGGYSGLVKMHKQTKEISPLKLDHVIYSMEIFPGDDRFLLLGAEGGGLIKYNVETDTFENITNQWISFKGYDTPWMWIYDIFNDGDSVYWCGAQNGIIKYNIRNHQVDLFEGNKSGNVNFGSVFNIYRSFDGKLYAGGDISGLSIFNKHEQRFETYKSPANKKIDFGSFRVNHITQTADSVFWISTDKGLIQMYQNHIKIISQKDGLLNDFVYAVIPDNQSKLWMSTNNGIFSFDRLSDQIASYSIYDRLQDQEFNTAAYYKSADGTIYFGGVNGFNYFNPEEISQDNVDLPIEIIGFYLNNEELQLAKEEVDRKEYRIPAGTEFFKIEFSALNYHANLQFRYKYKIEQLHSDWIDINHKNELSFHDLSPGRYSLALMVANQHGNWNSEPLEIKIYKASFFWETRVFKYGLIVILVLLVFLIFNYRYVLIKKQKIEIEKEVQQRTLELSDVNHELRKANETKDKFLAIVSHDIKNPLAAIQSVSSDLLENDNRYSNDERRDLLNIIYRSMKHLQVLLLNLSNWSQLQNSEIKPHFSNCDLHQLINDNKKLVLASLRKKELDISINLDPNLKVWADCEMINTIIRNLISNAIKFSYKGSGIHINAQKKELFVELQVIDFGVGMTEEQVNQLFIPGLSKSLPGTNEERGTGFGLLMVHEFVKLNGGKINVISEPGSGSSFIITLLSSKE